MDSVLQRNIRALAQKAYASGRTCFTDFLSVSEIAELKKIERELSYACPVLFGGYQNAERAVLCLSGSPAEAGLSPTVSGGGKGLVFPIIVLKITPLGAKFSSPLTQRDFLGAVLSLGIERRVIGDVIEFGGVGYVFCLKRMVDFIKENLTSVGRSSVAVEEFFGDIEVFKRTERVVFSVSSLRADCVVAGAYKLSRSEAERYFKGELVFINGRRAFPEDKLKAGDALTVRGKGRLVFCGKEGVSRKGKAFVAVEMNI